MTFSLTNLPANSDKLRIFPGQVNTNQWPRIQANIVANHVFQNTAGVTPGAAEDQSGFHTIIAFQNQTVDPSTISDATQSYTKTVGSINEIFIKTNTGVVKQLTGKFLQNANGYAFLPGGFLLQWGSRSAVSNLDTFTWPIGFTTLYSATLTAVTDLQGGWFATWNATPTAAGGTVAMTTTNGGPITANKGHYFWQAVGLA